jgi:hypothetical protein
VFSLIRWIFGLLLKPSGWVLLGVIIMVLAGLMFWVSQGEVPERAALTQVAGVLSGAKKFTRGRTHSVRYDIEITGASGEPVQLTLRGADISEEHVRGLLGRPVDVLLTPAKAVWELSAGGMKYIRYEDKRQQMVEFNAFGTHTAPYLFGGGLLASLTGVLWLRRRRAAVA